MPKDSDRSLARIDRADLLRLAALAADAEAELFRRNPQGSGRYADRLLGRALCQGAALHYVNETNGVEDFDVWSFYADCHGWPSRLGGVGRGISVPQGSADTPVIRHVTQADA